MRAMRADDVRSSEPVRHGAYMCLPALPAAQRDAVGAVAAGLADRWELQNEFETTGGHPEHAIAFLRRVEVLPVEITDDGLERAYAIVHVAAPTAGPVDAFCDEVVRLLNLAITPRILRGVVRPTNYTSNALHNYSYAHQVVQQPGAVMPNAFLVPMSKTADWWEKDWMERHTYFLPRYDEEGRMVHEGHALAGRAGIPYLLRRTYKPVAEPTPAGTYEFVNYFECADDGVPAFHAVCAALRDVARNPEWAFVREGPTWHGRRVATWADLFA